MRMRLSVKGVDEDAMELLAELREEERRQVGAIIGDAIRHYHELVMEGPDEDGE